MTPEEIISAVAIVVIGLLFIAEKVYTGKTVEALTKALSEAKDNSMLVDQAHALATEVIPAETGTKLIGVIGDLATLFKTVTPDNVDKAIDQAADLADEVIKGRDVQP